MIKTCLLCHEEYKALKRKSIYCSRACSDKASSLRMKSFNYKHGMRNSRFYVIWHGIMLRCLTPKANSYKNYGAKGIFICKEWQNFNNFKNDMYESYLSHCEVYGEKNTTIDRIDNSKGYELNNCRWATWSLQEKNKLIERERNEKGQYI